MGWRGRTLSGLRSRLGMRASDMFVLHSFLLYPLSSSPSFPSLGPKTISGLFGLTLLPACPQVTGLKLSLLRRLRLLAPTSDEAPLVTSSIHTERFHGVGYDVAANSERDLQVQMKVPDDQEAHSVRKGTLFEIDTFVRVEVDCGFLAYVVPISPSPDFRCGSLTT